MITIEQLNKLEDCGITLGVLKLLLVTEQAARIDDICEKTGLTRRSIEKMINAKPRLLNRFYDHEGDTGITGAPRTKMIIRTANANKLMTNIFE